MMFVFSSVRNTNTAAIFVALSLGFLLFIGPTYAAPLDLSAAKQVGKNIISFDDFTSVLAGDGVSLSINSSVDGDLSARYRFGDLEEEIFSQTVKGGQQVFLPAPDKFIVLSKPGVHEFSIQLNSSSDSDVRTISVLVAENKTINEFKNSKNFGTLTGSSIEEVVYEPSLDIAGNLSYGPEELDIVTTRGIASELYKALAPSVVLSDVSAHGTH